MKRGLTIDIGTVYVNFVVIEQRNDIVNVRMIDGMEHDVVAHFFDLANHCLNNLNIIIKPDIFCQNVILKLEWNLKTETKANYVKETLSPVDEIEKLVGKSLAICFGRISGTDFKLWSAINVLGDSLTSWKISHRQWQASYSSLVSQIQQDKP